MIRSTNLYYLTRNINKDLFEIYNKVMQNKSKISTEKDNEINSLKILVNKLIENNVDINKLDGFYYSYQIPQISKEFDLLKITNDLCLNIELKSQLILEEEIEKQLNKNKYYLKELCNDIYLYTIVTDSMKCYKLNNSNKLMTCDFNEIISLINELDNNYIDNIETLFKPSEYLISPINTPNKFLKDEYFLTSSQESIKNDIVLRISNNKNKVFKINGKPGTGKTLLVYDIGKKLSNLGKVLIIHCGILSDGHKYLNKCLQDNITIISAKSLTPELLEKYDYIIVDESQRIYIKQYKMILDNILAGKKTFLFAIDPNQILSHDEYYRNINDELEKIKNIKTYTLNIKIRTNEELKNFIKNLFDLNNKQNKYVDYSNIKLLYANDDNELDMLFKSLNEYKYINYSGSNYNDSYFDRFNVYSDTHHVIGQEFDNVALILNDRFYYNETGKLMSRSHPNPDYIYTQLLYQNITRVKNKLAIIVLNNEELFKNILNILNQ